MTGLGRVLLALMVVSAHSAQATEIGWLETTRVGKVTTPQDLAEADRVALADGAWKPTAEQTVEARDALKNYLGLKDAPSLKRTRRPINDEALRRSVQARGLDAYLIRIQGVIGVDPARTQVADIDGKRLIQMYGYCEVYSDSWKSSGHFVFDGGDCYFDALYDPEAKAIVSFYVNGLA